MAVMPQSDDNKGQTMLNILSGKTWTAEDVQASISAQNFSTAENPADVLNLQQSAKNFTLSPTQNQNTNSENLPLANLNQFQNVNLNQVQPQNLNPEQQPQIQNQPQIQVQPQNLNVEQSAQVQIQNQAQVQIQPQNLNSVQPQQILNQTQSQQVLEQIQNQMQIQNQIQTEPQTQPVVNSLQPQIQPNQLNQLNQQQSISDLLGANVQVEDNQSAAPLSPIPQMLRQQPEQNQQSPNQNFQQTFSQNLNPEIQTQQQNFGVENTFAQNLTPAVDNVSTPQPVVQTQSAEIAAQAARENENIPAQIVQQARLIRNAENTEMVINLKPEHLGQLTLRVSVSQNGAVNASFFSDNAQVRAAIENSIVQLKQELSDQGLKVDNVQVSAYLNDSGLMNRQGGQAWQQQQQQGNGRRIDFDTLQEEVDAVTPLNENISTDGVDYKV
ncbi:MAG: flagellar hook-length control protein FliK [Selenomonadaceae bacterium]|nr:flagellar hook-length control protein FliK [Selenomonadaceae bacterium]